MADSLPNEIVQSIAISNAKSIGEQPAILANMALANQIFNINIATQNFLAQQQAMNQVMLAAVAKAVAVILSADGLDADGKASGAQQALDLVEQLQRQFQATQKAIQDASQANLDMSTRFAEQLKQSQAPAAPPSQPQGS